MIGRAIDIPTRVDARGKLSVIEEGAQMPFAARRIYYLYDVGIGQERGFHAHLKLEQVFFAIGGSVRLILDDAKTREVHVLDQPNRGVYVPRMVWRELEAFSPGVTCIVLASDLFREGDYIRNYDEFVRVVRRGSA
jgi:dTDP-4-dehydrorhamnose 3,5-epimerase-like enzyme